MPPQNRHACGSLIGALSTPVVAHPHDNKADEFVNYEQVSASQAKRIARTYLTKQGYSRHIGPGGARINSVTRREHLWLVEVFLRTSSATGGDTRILYIDSATGRLSELAPTSQLLLGDSADPTVSNSEER